MQDKEFWKTVGWTLDRFTLGLVVTVGLLATGIVSIISFDKLSEETPYDISIRFMIDLALLSPLSSCSSRVLLFFLTYKCVLLSKAPSWWPWPTSLPKFCYSCWLIKFLVYDAYGIKFELNFIRYYLIYFTVFALGLVSPALLVVGWFDGIYDY